MSIEMLLKGKRKTAVSQWYGYHLSILGPMVISLSTEMSVFRISEFIGISVATLRVGDTKAPDTTTQELQADLRMY
jgi:hypothetical protein